MAKDRYIVIQEWMLDLGLKGSELLAYALVWGFCQDAESEFHGNVAYVARWCGISRQQASAVLKKLTDAGHITKSCVPGFPAHYRISHDEGVKFSGVSNNLTRGVKESDKGCKISLPPTTPYKDSDKIDIDINTCPSPRTREDMNSYGEYVRMTAANYSRLVSRFGADDAARLCEILDSYLAKKPNVYRDHYRAALGWPVQRLQEEKLNQQRLKNAQEAGARVNGQQTVGSNMSAEDLARIRRFEEKLERERNGLL